MIRTRMSASAGTTWTILLFWIAQYSLLTAQQMLMEPKDDASYLLPRACVTLIGITLSFVIAAVLRRYRNVAPRGQIVVTVIAALLACVLHAAGNFAIFDLFMRDVNRMEADLASYFMAVIQWFWCYAALSGLLLVLSYSFQAGQRDRRIAQLRHEADTAQMRALRYQLNPHFMFNTLNSVAALIGRPDARAAEAMVENLADFLRASLSLDPQDDIALAREIELQSLYLGIESVRFAERLRIEIQVSEDAGRGLVPSLILQPLVENVLKYAVSPSMCPVILVIAARVEAGFLKIAVRNSAGDGVPRSPRGTGVGLANVEARLVARFGDAAVFRPYKGRDGGFTVDLSMPYVVAA
ncbi:histidine kinase [Sphingomonas sp. SUN019]|uniref:sensor histidine kinase n=1 Tax=Sphingomonas sp. SUN019 TaxID=2937788 RepID=UPI00216442C4|nr:histidine kinase [Sphingomonas sp. SUN019]UVO50125.1 histidine kinase [Sphingomonas sp. SUN019]